MRSFFLCPGFAWPGQGCQLFRVCFLHLFCFFRLLRGCASLIVEVNVSEIFNFVNLKMKLFLDFFISLDFNNLRRLKYFPVAFFALI